jgi:succinyl-diaminopimelate desuccinylase
VWEYSNSNVFVTKPGAFTDLAVSAIEEVTGRKPELSTSAAPPMRASSRAIAR